MTQMSVVGRDWRHQVRRNALVAGCAIALVSAGCGQKGPLTLPGTGNHASPSPATPAASAPR